MKIDHDSLCRILAAPISPLEIRVAGLFAFFWFLMDAFWFAGTLAGWF